MNVLTDLYIESSDIFSHSIDRYIKINRKSYSGIVIAGSTASGKSSLALEIMQHIKTLHITLKPVIINADSVQIYNIFPKLSAQPTDLTDHYLYNFLDIDQKYSSHQWLLDLQSLLSDNPDFFPIIVGGTGFYINALLSGMHILPTRAAHTIWDVLSISECIACVESIYPLAVQKFKDKQRLIRFLDLYHNHNINLFTLPNPTQMIKKTFFTIYKTNPSDIIKNNIKIRLKQGFDDFILEVSQFLHKNPSQIIAHTKDFCDDISCSIHTINKLNHIIGFSEIKAYLNGAITQQSAFDLIYTRTCQYAKRQNTWFKKYYHPKITL